MLIYTAENIVELSEECGHNKEWMKKEFLDLQAIKKMGFWKEGNKTYVIEEKEYPHDENCEEGMCHCGNREKKRIGDANKTIQKGGE